MIVSHSVPMGMVPREGLNMTTRHRRRSTERAERGGVEDGGWRVEGGGRGRGGARTGDEDTRCKNRERGRLGTRGGGPKGETPGAKRRRRDGKGHIPSHPILLLQAEHRQHTARTTTQKDQKNGMDYAPGAELIFRAPNHQQDISPQSRTPS